METESLVVGRRLLKKGIAALSISENVIIFIKAGLKEWESSYAAEDDLCIFYGRFALQSLVSVTITP